MAKKRPPCARAIIYAAVLGELEKADAEKLLLDAGLGAYQSIPDGTWKMLKSKYVPYFRENPKALGKFIYKPMPVGDFADEEDDESGIADVISTAAGASAAPELVAGKSQSWVWGRLKLIFEFVVAVGLLSWTLNWVSGHFAEKARTKHLLEAFVNEVHNNDNIALGQLAIVERNREVNYNSVEIGGVSSPTLAIAEHLLIANGTALLDHGDDYQVFAAYLAEEEGMRDAVENRERLLRSSGPNMGIFRQLDNQLEEMARNSTVIGNKLLQRLQSYGLSTAVFGMPGQISYWSHKPGDGSMMTFVTPAATMAMFLPDAGL